MRSVYFSFILTISINLSIAQEASPGLDALLDNSKIIVEGQVLKKHCRGPMGLSSVIANMCVISLEVKEIIKGRPLISDLEIQNHVIKGSDGMISSLDTLKGICFEHVRMNGPLHFDASNIYMDYDVKIGDNVIIFLNDIPSSNIQAKLNIPKDWIVYPLIDKYLGVITANDYVMDYLENKLREK